MLRIVLLCLAFAASAAQVFADTDKRWAQLRVGMSKDETAAVLGRPLLRTAGKGFELWIYNHGAEVVFHAGPVFAWTAPTVIPMAAPAPAKRYTHDVFFLPGYRMPQHGTPVRRDSASEGYSLREILRYRSRQ